MATNKRGSPSQMLASMMAFAGFNINLNEYSPKAGFRPKSISGRRKKNPRLIFKPACSYGFRGWRRTEKPCGSIPAPTIEQVRHIERKYGHRIHVKRGLMFFKSDGVMFTKEEAKRRMCIA